MQLQNTMMHLTSGMIRSRGSNAYMENLPFPLQAGLFSAYWLHSEINSPTHCCHQQLQTYNLSNPHEKRLLYYQLLYRNLSGMILIGPAWIMCPHLN